MKELKLKGGLVLNVPESYSELTFKQYIDIAYSDGLSDAHFLAAIVGMNVDDFVKIKDSDVDIKIFAEIDWVTEPPKFDKNKIPSSIRINGKSIKIPKDIGYETYEQKVAVTNYITPGMKDQEIMAYMIAVYLYPGYYGEFNEDGVLDFMEKIIYKQSIASMIGIGNFFLKNLKEFLNYKINYYRKTMKEKS